MVEIGNYIETRKYGAVTGMFEIMPGVIGKIIRQFANGPIPVLVGGLIDTKEEIAEALSNGAVAISTSKKELWEI